MYLLAFTTQEDSPFGFIIFTPRKSVSLPILLSLASTYKTPNWNHF